MSIVMEYIRNLIARQVNGNGLVVWYDSDDTYTEAIQVLELPNTTVLRYAGSFVHLRWEIDQKRLMDGEEPPRLVVYVPIAHDQTHHALIELEAAGMIMQSQAKVANGPWPVSSFNKECERKTRDWIEVKR